MCEGLKKCSSRSGCRLDDRRLEAYVREEGTNDVLILLRLKIGAMCAVFLFLIQESFV